MEHAATPPTSTVAAASGAAGKDASALLARLVAGGGAPRLTWYADGGERIELSGAVLGNWVTKTANLLVEEFDAGPESTVTIDLPAHWRGITWALAAWRVGACVDVRPGAEPGDVVVTTEPERWAGRGSDVVAVSLAPLARSFGAPLPPGVVDAAASVMTYGDVLGYVPPTDPDAPALVHDGGTVAHAALLAWALAGPAGPLDAGARTLVVARDPAAFLRDATATWARDGSVVAVTPDVAGLATSDPERWERLVAGERVDVRPADTTGESQAR